MRAWLTSKRSAILVAVRSVAAVVVSSAGLWQLGLLLKLWYSRYAYPTDIEWLEGTWIYQAHRLLAGQFLYGPISAGFLPNFHPPLHTVALAAVGSVVGLDYSTARTFSLACFLIAGALMVRALVRHEAGRAEGWVAGLLTVGCAAAGAPLCETFYDLVRPDIFAVTLIAIGAVLAQEKKPGRLRLVLLGLVLSAALYTRLVMVFFIAWIVLFVFIRNRRAGFMLALYVASACGITLVALLMASKGWYWIATVSFATSHHVDWKRVIPSVKMLFEFAPFAPAIPLGVLVLAPLRKLSTATIFWVGMSVCAIPASLMPLAKVGGFHNDLIPYCLFLGPAAAFVASDAIKALARWPRTAESLRWIGFVAAGAFLVARTYDMKRFIPTEDNWRQANALNAEIASLEGKVLAPRHPFLPVRNGKTNAQYFEMPYLDLLWSNTSGTNLGRYLDRVNADWALVTGTELPGSVRELSARFQLDRPLPAPEMLLGERSRLRFVLRRLDDESTGHVLFDFEDPALPGWTVTGTAFEASPSVIAPKGQNAIVGAVGARLANSFRYDLPGKGDAVTGVMASPPFLIDRERLSFRLGGGGRRNKVWLRIDGREVRSATVVFRDKEVLLRHVWDVSDLYGKDAELVITDGDSGPWGHILVDHVVLY